MTVTFDDTPGRKVAVLGHFLNNVKFWSLFYFEVAFRTFLVAFGHLLGLMSLLHKKEGPLKLSKNPKSTFYRIWSVFGGVSNLLPISADYSLKFQIGIGKNWVGPPPYLFNYNLDCFNQKQKSHQYNRLSFEKIDKNLSQKFEQIYRGLTVSVKT